MKKLLVILIGMMLLALVSCGTQVAPERNPETPIVENPAPSEKNYLKTEESNEVENSQYTFELRDTSSFSQEIVQIDINTKEEKVVVSDIRKNIAHLPDSVILKIFATPQTSDFLFYKTILIDTDNPSGEIYSFHTKTFEFKKLKINDGFFAGFGLSPNQTKFVLVPTELDSGGDDKIIKICDLIEDVCNDVFSLTGDETLNAGNGGMTNAFEIEWTSDSQIKYGVFNQSKKTQDEYYPDNKNKIFIESRILKI